MDSDSDETARANQANQTKRAAAGDVAGSARRPDHLATSPLVLFDLDDTLCDYSAARATRLRIAFSGAFEAIGSPRQSAMLDALVAESIAIHPNGVDHFADLLGRHGVADAAIVEASRVWCQTNRFHGLALFPDVATILATVRAAVPGRRLGVITNGPADVQRDKVALLGVEPHVDFIIISGEFGVAKPDPAIFAEALRHGRASAADAVFIGDSVEHDMAGAFASGLGAIWLNRFAAPWTPSGRRPDHEIRSIAEVIPLLNGRGAV